MKFPRLNAVNAMMERAEQAPYVQESEALEWSVRGKRREYERHDTIITAAARESLEAMMTLGGDEYF